MSSNINMDRVRAFCEWLKDQPADDHFSRLPGFQWFADMKPEEFAAAAAMMRELAAEASAEAGALRDEVLRRRNADV